MNRIPDGKLFTIVIDTREQRPYTFSRVPFDRSELSRSGSKSSKSSGRYSLQRGEPAGQPLQYHDVPTERCTLESGDYSLLGFEKQIAIERKSKEDLFSTLAQGRDRFEREINRLNSFEPSVFDPHIKPFACVLCECEWSDIIRDPPPHTKLQPKSILRTVIAWQQRYRNVHWLFIPGRDVAEIIAFRLLQRWWRDNIEKNLESQEQQEQEQEQS